MATLTFAEQSYTGVIRQYVVPPFQTERIRLNFPALEGAAELTGGSGGRPLEIPFQIQGYETSEACINAIKEIERLAREGTHGTLVLAAGFTRTFDNTTLDGVAVLKGPMPPLGSPTGYWAELRLIFFQLVEEQA